MIANQYNNILIPSDTNGTFFWRAQQQVQTIWALGHDTGINNSVICRPVLDPKYYEDVTMVMVQRMLTDGQLRFTERFLDPYSEILKFWTVYNIDDAMHCDDIPKYNRGRRAYVGEKVQENIRKMLNLSDFVLTTTDYIKEYYHRKYGVPLRNIIAIPNYLPKWWFGRFFDLKKSVERYKAHRSKGKLRVGIISSLSHFNIEKNKLTPEGKVVYFDKKDDKVTMVDEDGKILTSDEGLLDIQDDMDIILDTVERTIEKFQWVFLGHLPERLRKYAEAHKIEVHPGVPVTSYPTKLASLELDCVVAPLVDNEFNRCKSNIKWLECSAIGVPLFASRIDPTYTRYMPEDQMFKDQEDLYDKLDYFSHCSVARFEAIVANQWKFINSPHDECGIKSKSWWLEDCLDPWKKLFKMRTKCARFSLRKYLEVQRKKEADLEDRILWQNGNGARIYK